MKVCLVSQEYPPETAHGGIATQTHAKAHGLAALGHNVHVISHSIDAKRHEYRDGAVHVTRIPGFDSALPINTEPARWLTYSALVAAEVGALHARLGLDLIDFPEWGGEGFVYLLNRTAWDRAPVVVLHLHGPLIMLANTIGWPEKDSELFRIGTMMESTCLRLADAVMSSSRCSADWCAKHYQLDIDVPVIHTGVDTEIFKPGVVARSRRPTLLFVGRVADSKGVRRLVEVACDVARDVEGLRVRLVGRVDFDFREELVKIARTRGWEQLLDFVGFVPHANLPHEYCRAHLMAAPSRYEGGPGFVYLEAMACGIPVIACAGNGSSEIISEDIGVLVPPDDSPALGTAIRRLLDDETRRARMGSRAREYAVTQADARVCIAKLEHYYASVFAARK